MEPAVIIVGYLSLNKQQIKAWRACLMDHDRFEWSEDGAFSGTGPSHYRDVASWLAAHEGEGARAGANYLAVDLPEDGDEVMVSGFIGDEEVFFEWHQDLATVVRLAGTVGGTGEVLFILPSEQVGWSIEVDDEDSEIAVLEAEEAGEAVAEYIAEITTISNFVQALHTSSGPISRREFYVAEANFQLGDIKLAPAQERTVAALAKRNPHELWHIADIAELETPRGALLTAELTSADELAAAIADRAPIVRVTGIELLAEVDAKAAEPLAQELARDPSPYVRSGAFMALGRIGGEAALEILLDIPDRFDASVPGRVEAVGMIEHPQAEERLLALLTNSPVFKPDIYVIDEDDAQALAEAEKAHTKARIILQMIGQRSMSSAAPALVALFHDPPFPELRESVVTAMLEVGGPEVDAEAERIHNFLHGMGLALNQDAARRREILGIPDAADENSADGLARFEALRADGLRALMEENFVNPMFSQSDAPAAVELLDFMEEWPEITASGFAVGKQRNDYRVQIDGLSCVLSEVAPERRKTLRKAFEAMCSEAARVSTQGDVLSASW